MTLIGDYHLSLATAFLGLANTLLLLVVIMRQKKSGVFNDGYCPNCRRKAVK